MYGTLYFLFEPGVSHPRTHAHKGSGAYFLCVVPPALLQLPQMRFSGTPSLRLNAYCTPHQSNAEMQALQAFRLLPSFVSLLRTFTLLLVEVDGSDALREDGSPSEPCCFRFFQRLPLLMIITMTKRFLLHNHLVIAPWSHQCLVLMALRNI